MRTLTEGWVERCSDRLGFPLSITALEGARSPTVTAIALPDGITAAQVTAAVEARGFVIGGGQDRLQHTTVRIGHMGDHTLEGLSYCLDVVEEALGEVMASRRVLR
jgi:aspartate aminotransferase-like enzyme